MEIDRTAQGRWIKLEKLDEEGVTGVTSVTEDTPDDDNDDSDDNSAIPDGDPEPPFCN